MLEVKNLTIAFGEKKVVNNISFAVKDGQVTGIVGESGSGKSMTSLAIMGLLPEEANATGEIKLDGENLLKLDEKTLASYKGSKMSIVFQEPMTSLNPVIKIGRQVGESLKIHTDMNKEQRKAKVIETLRLVELKDAESIYNKYPHQLSGGMRQRVMIAMAIINNPTILIADEPTTALDVTIQSQILRLLKKINKELNTSILFVSHDLGVIKYMCEDTIVMRDGSIVEQGLAEKIFNNPTEDYTKTLINSIPKRIKKGV